MRDLRSYRRVLCSKNWASRQLRLQVEESECPCGLSTEDRTRSPRCVTLLSSRFFTIDIRHAVKWVWEVFSLCCCCYPKPPVPKTRAMVIQKEFSAFSSVSPASVCISYVHVVSETIRKLLMPLKIQTVFKAHRTAPCVSLSLNWRKTRCRMLSVAWSTKSQARNMTIFTQGRQAGNACLGSGL